MTSSATIFTVLFAIATTTFVVGVANAAPKRAEKQACVDAATRGQIQRDDGKLTAAAQAFEECAAAACPIAVRKSCTEWLADAKQRMPHVTVRLEPGEDPSMATVRIDDVTASLDTPVTLDPGTHSVDVERPGKPRLHEQFTLTAGEDKTVTVRPPRVVTMKTPEPVRRRPVPAGVFVLGGVAVLGVGSWATFGLMAKSDTDRMLEDCAPGCEASQKDSAFTKAVVADISLGLAVLATAFAAIVFFTRETEIRSR